MKGQYWTSYYNNSTDTVYQSYSGAFHFNSNQMQAFYPQPWQIGFIEPKKLWLIYKSCAGLFISLLFLIDTVVHKHPETVTVTQSKPCSNLPNTHILPPVGPEVKH